MFNNLPIRNPQPDGGRFVRTILGQEHPARPPLFEYIADSERIVRPVVDRDAGAAVGDPRPMTARRRPPTWITSWRSGFTWATM